MFIAQTANNAGAVNKHPFLRPQILPAQPTKILAKYAKYIFPPKPILHLILCNSLNMSKIKKMAY